MITHVKILAWLHIVLGAGILLAGLLGFLFFGGMAGLAGIAEHDPDAWIAVPILGGIGGLILVFALFLAIPGIIAGAGLLALRPWARILTIVLSALNLVHVPIGTALGIYGLWVLLSAPGAALFQAAQPAGANPYMK